MALTAGTDSYCTLEEANSYIATKLNDSVWVNATDAEKEKALIGACIILDSYQWIGRKPNESQVLAWPRYLSVPLVSLDLVTVLDEPITPKHIKYAQTELAVKLLTGFSFGDNVEQIKVGPLTITQRAGYASVLPPEIMHLIRPFVSMTAKLVRT